MIVVFLLLVNCNNKGETSKFPAINIKPNKNSIECNLSDIVSDLKVISLETNSECLIGHFSNLLYLDDHHIIFKSDKTILIFDGKGKFLKKINALGKGPAEYNTIISSYVDNINKSIYIIDYKQVLVYNYEGDFIKSYKTTFSAAGLIRNRNGQFILPIQQVYKNSDRNMLHILDSSFNIVKSFKSRNPELTTNLSQNLFFSGNPYKTENRVFYKEPFVDTIYEIKSKGIEPYLKIDLNGLGFKTKDGINSGNYQIASKNKISPMGLIEFRGLFFISYNYKNEKIIDIYSENSREFIFHKKYAQSTLKLNPMEFGIKNDLLEGGPNFWPKYFQNNLMVSSVAPFMLTNKQQKLLNVANEDNQILFVATIK